MPNTLAYLSIIIWPIIVLLLLSKKNIAIGIFIAYISSYLFLPANFEINIQGIPAFNKQSTTVLTISLYLLMKGISFGLKDIDIKVKLALCIYILIPILTSATNQFHHLHLPPMTLYDGITQSYIHLLIAISFLIGAKFYQNDELLNFNIFKVVVIFGLIYSVLIAYEIRMSPQLHNQIYGFFPHHFGQQIRGGGFRAVVFLGHGLLVAIFLSMVIIFSANLAKNNERILGVNAYLITTLLFILLFLSKSIGALFLATLGLYIYFFTKLRTTSYLAFAVSGMILIYPFLATSGAIPYDLIIHNINAINDERARSLEFRFSNEKILLARAFEKPFFGWGSWGRNRVYNPETLQDISVTDGHWIILIGTYGFIGFVSVYYIFFKTFVNVTRLSKYSSNDDTIKTLTIVMLIILIDQIPNSSLNYFYFFMLGILYGKSLKKIRTIKLKKNRPNLID